MKIQIAVETTGYMTSRIAAVNSDIKSLDLTEQVPDLYSSGWAEPIREIGKTNRYDVSEIEVPEWLLDVIKRGQLDGRWFDYVNEKEVAMSPELIVARIFCNYETGGWCSAIATLARKNKLSKFEKSLKEYAIKHGRLTDKQADSINNPRQWNRRY